MDKENSKTRAQSREPKIEEKKITDAIASLTVAFKGIDNHVSAELIRSLLEKELKQTKDRLETLAGSLVKIAREREAFNAALNELGRLDSIAVELKGLEDSLLVGAPSGREGEVRAAISRMREKREVESKAFAEKLLDSRIIERRILRFGSLFDDFWIRMVYSDLIDHFGTHPGFSFRPSINLSGGTMVVANSGMISGGEDISLSGFDFLPSPEEVNTGIWLPALLPWPPPDPSSQVVLPRRLLAAPTLGDLDDQLTANLSSVGYSGSTYWGVPGGFALVTPIEQTNANGAPLDGRKRWRVSVAWMKSFSLSEYLKALFTAPPGYFRVLVFITSTEPFAPSGARMTLETIERWSGGGLNVLPEKIRGQPLTKRHRITVLVYEFIKRKKSDHPTTSVPGRVRARDHLIATGLTGLLRG